MVSAKGSSRTRPPARVVVSREAAAGRSTSGRALDLHGVLLTSAVARQTEGLHVSSQATEVIASRYEVVFVWKRAGA
jgi:hypothetical protein